MGHTPAFDALAVLRALIKQAAVGGETAALVAAIQDLAPHHWDDEEHRVVYHSLRAAIRHTAIPLRQQIAIEATRIGHPDVDWSLYF